MELAWAAESWLGADEIFRLLEQRRQVTLGTAEPVFAALARKGHLERSGGHDGVARYHPAANAVRHSRSGREGGTFTARLLDVPGQYVLGEIEDGGSDWGGDLQRSARDASGLYFVLNLAAASGVRGDRWKRVVWFRTPYALGSGPGPSGEAGAA